MRRCRCQERRFLLVRPNFIGKTAVGSRGSPRLRGRLPSPRRHPVTTPRLKTPKRSFESISATVRVAEDIKRVAKAGIAPATLRRARERCGVRVYKEGSTMTGGWYWCLDDVPVAADRRRPWAIVEKMAKKKANRSKPEYVPDEGGWTAT